MVPIPMKKRQKASPNLLRVLIGIFIAVALVYWVAGIRDLWEIRVHWDRQVESPFTENDDTLAITGVKPEAKAVGLTIGDKLTDLDGTPYTGEAQWQAVIAAARPGDTVDIGFTRPNGSRGMATITLRHGLPPSSSPMAFFWSEAVVAYLLPLICLGIGAWVAFAKPREKNAWLLLILLTFPTVLFSGQNLETGTALSLRILWYLAIQYAGAPALLLFGVYFPERSRIDIKLPWIKRAVLVLLALCWCVIFPAIYMEYYLGGLTPAWLKANHVAANVDSFLELLCVLLYLVLTLDKLRSASTQDARRRLRVLTVGMAVGMGALLIVFILLPHFGVTGWNPKYTWIRYTGAFLFMVAPFTLGYVVLVQRAMDVRAILRVGTRYALTKWSLWVVERLLLIVVCVRLIVPFFSKKQPQLSDLIGPLIALVVVVAVRMGMRKRLGMWLDRKFFRESYDAEHVLRELSDEVRRFTESAPLLETVARCVVDTLHVEQIAMLLRRGDIFQIQQSIGFSVNGNGAAALSLPMQSSTVRYLTDSNQPALLYRDDPDAWYLMAGSMERKVLDAVNAELLLPLPGRNRLMGVMALGPKRSQAAYSRADLSLLQSLALQTGLALEVSELAHSLAREAAQRERTNREMEIAREVQERLFPQQMPHIPGATIAGHCRPALGVGGDYYDVFEMDQGRVGIAIGDVSGKGISAALLMASLRASLRGMTLDNPRDLALMMDKVNRLVYEASASNRYATFFFASYDPATRKLDCVNAGHNPPLLVRTLSDGATRTIRLEADGPVVGLLPAAPYTEQSVTLQPGDLLVTYTDGISEAMTHDEEEWGEERMLIAAGCVREKSAREVLDCIFEEADAFTAGAPQHDDMTLLVLKLEA